MSYLIVRSLHGDTEATIRYCRNVRKTVPVGTPTGRRYAFGINCSPDRAAREWKAVRQRYGTEGGVTALSVVQVFPEGMLDAAKAHAIGIRCAEEIWGDRFQVLVCTHLDRPYLHNHILVCSTSFADGRKITRAERRIPLLREKFRQSLEEADILDPDPVSDGAKNWEEHPTAAVASRAGRMTLRDTIRWDLSRAADASLSFSEFERNLGLLGYTLFREEPGGPPRALQPPGADRIWNFSGLGAGWSVEELLRRIHSNAERIPLCTSGERSAFLREAEPFLARPDEEPLYARFARYVGLLGCADDHPRAAFPLPVPERIALFSLSRRERLAAGLAELGIRSEEELRNRYRVLTLSGDSLSRELKRWRERLRTGHTCGLSREEAERRADALLEKLRPVRAELRILRGAARIAPELDRSLERLSAVCREPEGREDPSETKERSHFR